jgi:hypothetical protein
MRLEFTGLRFATHLHAWAREVLAFVRFDGRTCPEDTSTQGEERYLTAWTAASHRHIRLEKIVRQSSSIRTSATSGVSNARDAARSSSWSWITPANFGPTA